MRGLDNIGMRFSCKKINAKTGKFKEKLLLGFHEDQYNFRLGSFVDVAVRQTAVSSRQSDLNVQ